MLLVKDHLLQNHQNHLFLKDFDLLDDTIFCQFVQQSLEYDFSTVPLHNFSSYSRFYE